MQEDTTVHLQLDLFFMVLFTSMTSSNTHINERLVWWISRCNCNI